MILIIYYYETKKQILKCSGFKLLFLFFILLPKFIFSINLNEYKI